MLKMISNEGKWDVIINEIEYNFYYSDAKPLEGLILIGSNEMQDEYRIGDVSVTATKEDYIYNEKGYRYILNIENK